MDGNFFSLPFLAPTSLSDYACRDGEIASCQGATITSNPTSNLESMEGLKYEFIRNYRPVLPPVPRVKFALKAGVVRGWHVHPDQFPSQEIICENHSAAKWMSAASETLALFEAEASRNNLFTSPFLALAAWRLKSGALVSPTLPVLLIPNSKAPLVASLLPPDSDSLELRIIATAASLCWKIELPETLRDFISEISSLEILVSPPLSLYDPDSDPLFLRNYSHDAFSLILSGVGDDSTEKAVSAASLPYVWRFPDPVFSGQNTRITDLDSFHTLASFPLGSLKPVNTFTEIDCNCGCLGEVYASQAIKPSFREKTLENGGYAIKFKERTLMWDLHFKIPGFEDPENVTGNYSPSLTPRWIFHPDPEATEYQYTDSQGQRRSLLLRPHPTLHGSYWYGGLKSTQPAPSPALSHDAGERSYELPSYVWLSDSRHPDALYDSGLQDLKCGRIIAMCRAYRTSGLVATTTPTLYAFTSEGVFLFREKTDSTLSEAGMISGYVLGDISSLILLPGGLSFLSRGGTVVEISGTTAKSAAEASGTSAEKVFISGKNEMIKVVTRPLKLTSAADKKRLRGIMLNGRFSRDKIRVSAYGSCDLLHWSLLCTGLSPALSCLLAPKNRFFRIEIEGYLEEDSTLEGIDIRL